MADFHALAFAGKQNGVVADNIAAAHGGKADGLRIARASLAFATVHRAVFQAASERVGDDFAHAQGGAAGGCRFCGGGGLR